MIELTFYKRINKRKVQVIFYKFHKATEELCVYHFVCKYKKLPKDLWDLNFNYASRKTTALEVEDSMQGTFFWLLSIQLAIDERDKEITKKKLFSL